MPYTPYITSIEAQVVGLLYLGPDLPHGVAVSQRGRVRRLVHRVEVDGDAERHPDLVGAGVAPPDGS